MRPDICPTCACETTFPHDHKPDMSGLDDGPPLETPRRKPLPKSAAEFRAIRARAWQTRRAKYGPHGHRPYARRSGQGQGGSDHG